MVKQWAPLAHFDIERSGANLEAMLSLCGRRGPILILMQNNPDPDALASAAAVREMVRKRLKKPVRIGFGGALGRAENRAMVHELHLDVRRIAPDELAACRTLCLVDTQPRSGNNVLLTSRPADIVIDHHSPPKKTLWLAACRDIRPEYGATSTILCEYLAAANLPPSRNLATALYYGIMTDTQELGRDTHAADVAAFQALLPLVDRKRMTNIRRAPLSTCYFSMLRDSLTSTHVAGSAVITYIDDCSTPDMVGEMADLMLRLEHMRTSVCYGASGDCIHLSVRKIDGGGDSTAQLRRVIRGIGTGGGHRSMAGGQVPCNGDRNTQLRLVHERILRVFAPRGKVKALLE